ncbi:MULTISPECIES: RidA family protein [Pseudomonas]|uniref:RidA family protein n=1 Tax=Pseudomonas putida NBRC 14164 TaxID=1211579 RepID=A0ABM7EE88_PSEPU|nr:MULTISPECIES: RidA family protein [Pseudomonas]EKT4462787.1 RidA family protein [Pseudomonas putida]EKT4558169.1 RidA family protein [Pseudomonas putida]MCX9135564.1 RidA family protein [Pseudomonas sp. DCB_PUT]MDD1969557.1 RidA family protein [Pseudomonas putida]MDO1464788.1 RidA family protein [Pseudomonas putida]
MTQSTAFQLSNPEGLYDPSGNAYSHVAEVRANSRLLFIAGQGGEDSNGQLPPLFAEQARQALANLELALASKGASLAQVFKLTLLIVEHSEPRLRQWVAEADRAWGPHMKPACTLIPVPRLALDGMLVEIEAVAAL